MLKTLLHNSGDEVKYFHQIAGSFDGSYFKDNILSVEIKFFNSLSNEFYECLLADLKEEYCNADEFVKGTTYNTGDLVIYDGQLWCANAETCEPPECGWTKKSKFNTPCFEELWSCFLGKILTGLVFKMSSVGIHMKATPKGFTTVSSDAYDVIGTKELREWLKWFDQTLESTREAMLIYIRKDQSECFDKLKKCLPCEEEICDPCGGISVNKIPAFLSIVGGHDKYG